MRVENKDIVNAPVDQVYKIVRDDLMKLVEFMPNVSKIECKERSEKNGKIQIINHWYAKGEVPAVAKKFINPDILSWKDIAEWDDSAKTVEYRLESFVANSIFSVKGKNTFKAAADPNKTELLVVCDMEIYPDKVPGVPRLLAGTIKPVVEDFIGKLLKPNLTSLAQGLNRYLEKQ